MAACGSTSPTARSPSWPLAVDAASADWGVRLPGTEALLRTYDDADQPTDELVALEPGAWPQFYAQVAAAVRGEAPVPVDVADVIETMRVLDAARVAGSTGTVVTLDPPAAHR